VTHYPPIVRLVAGAALLLAGVGATSLPVAPTSTSAAFLAQATPVPFELPGAPGETDQSQDTGAGRSASTVDMAPGETGTLQEVSPEFTEAE
jgi:hypothetical protein